MDLDDQLLVQVLHRFLTMHGCHIAHWDIFSCFDTMLVCITFLVTLAIVWDSVRS